MFEIIGACKFSDLNIGEWFYLTGNSFPKTKTGADTYCGMHILWDSVIPDINMEVLHIKLVD